MRFKIFCILIIFVAIFSSCRSTKHVPKEKYLLNNVKIRSDVRNQSEHELIRYLRQTPNSRSFGLFRLRLGVYNISGHDSTKFNRFFQKLGDAPVIYDSMLTDRSVTELKKYLNNKGYLNADVDYEVFYRKKKARVEYNVTGNRPHRVGEFYYNIRNDTVLNIIRNDSAKTLIRKGMLFDTDVLNNERQRITSQLKNSGYYNFNKEYLRYRADSLKQSYVIDLRMSMRNATTADTAGQVLNVPHRQYYVRNVRFYTTYDPIVGTDFSSVDSLTCRCHTFYFNGNIGIRPEVLLDNCYIESGKLYNELQVEKTYSALNLLSAIKYVNIRMFEVANSDTLDCVIITSPARPQQYSFDVEGTNNDWDFGFAGTVGYQHKNLFHGSETFKASFRAAYEMLTYSISDILQYNDHSNEFGVETSLTFPKFLFPFLSYDFRRKIRAGTEFNLQYNYHRRPEYGRTIASAGVKYHWSHNKDMRHTVDLINVNYIYLPYTDSIFRNTYLNANSILKYSYENQLIVSSGYLFYLNRKIARDNITARAKIEGAGNILYGIAKAFDFKKVDDSYTISKIKFAQYLKTDLNFSYDKYIDYRNKIVYHAGVGIGVPYGNASVLPFEKRYFAGGANSMRGWNVRTLGPGVYKSKSGYTDYMSQSGDMKLDMNLEYRFKMFWVMEGALFADAGNIWTLTDYNTQPGGVFRFSDFLEQTALSYGVGLRFDFNFFLVRVDMGVKTYNPALDGADKWRFKNLNWEDDFAFHFAVGYPF